MIYSILIAASISDDEDDGHTTTVTAELPGSLVVKDTGLAATLPQSEDVLQRNTRRRAAPGAGEDPQAVAGKRRPKITVDLNEM